MTDGQHEFSTNEKTSILLKEADAARFLGLRERVLSGLRITEAGPDYLKIGRFYFYSRGALKAWVSKRSKGDSSRKVGRQSELFEKYIDLKRGEHPRTWIEKKHVLVCVEENPYGGLNICFDFDDGGSIAIGDAVLQSDGKGLDGPGLIHIIPHYGIAR